MRTPFIRERDGFQMLVIVLFLAFLAAVGGGVFLSLRTPPGQAPARCTQEAKLCPDGSAVGRTGPNCAFAPCPPTATTTPPGPEPVYCTLEAKQCPDGSYVGRVPPSCEFAPCPLTVNGNVPPAACKNQCGNGQCEEIVCLAVGCPCAETPASCPQDCAQPQPRECRSYASCQDGQACPAGTECSGLPAYGCYPPGCPTPICLAAATNIATPSGQVNVQKLMVGTKVWSLDAQGKKIVSTIVRVGRTPAPKNHRVVRLMLSDGREVRVSPDHPTANGQPVSKLQVGAFYDGARVTSADLVPYGEAATYDLLPDSASGAYWADGILLGSTLSASSIGQ
ncbi:hypothetical protein EPO33_04570 [Patescibacteria group bacterium]|nr:MAG: hypothetical protein EPO33_04570 [Patescibacteria group bacterium]